MKFLICLLMCAERSGLFFHLHPLDSQVSDCKAFTLVFIIRIYGNLRDVVFYRTLADEIGVMPKNIRPQARTLSGGMLVAQFFKSALSPRRFQQFQFFMG